MLGVGGLVASPAPAVAAAPEPLLHYTFDEITGAPGSIADAAGAHNATLVNSGQVVQGVSGSGGDKALKLTGGAKDSTTAPYVTIPGGLLEGKESLTVSTWVDWDKSNRQFEWLWGLGRSTTHNLNAIPRGPGGVTTAGLVQGSGTDVTASAPSVIGDGWTHVAVVLDTDADALSLFVDGRLAGSRPTTLAAKGLVVDGAALSGYIGKSFWSDPYFPGVIDDFRIYDVALGEEELQEIASQGGAAIAAADAGALDLGDISAVRSDLALPTSGAGGSTITWESSDPGIISETGVVTRPAGGSPDAHVTLSATVTKAGAAEVVEFGATVKAYLGEFADVTSGHPYYNEIRWLARTDISRGFEESGVLYFRPEQPITREYVAEFLYNYSGSSFEPASGAQAFSDVPPDHPHYAQIEWLAAHGYAEGQQFGPGEAVTREELAATLWRLAGYPVASAAVPYTDVPANGANAGAIAWVHESGLIDGTGADSFGPQVEVSRGAAAAALFRYDATQGSDAKVTPGRFTTRR